MGTGKSRNTFQVRKRNSRRLYALKEIRNPVTALQAQDADAVETTKMRAFSLANNPFIVPVKFVFQSAENLYWYLVSPFIHGGELIQLLFNERCSDVDRIKHYAAEILCGLEFLHDSGIVYGYLKSRNILLDFSGHISICDFALSQPHMKDHTDGAYHTNEACAPEICLGQGYTQTADWWTLGILLAEMLTITSFKLSWYEENIINLHSNARPIVFLAVVPPSAQDICIKLLNRNPEQRLGAKSVADIKAHSFFDGIDWSMVLKREYEPVFKPNDAHFRTGSNPQILPPLDPPMSTEEAEHCMKKAAEMCGMFVGWPTKCQDRIRETVEPLDFL